MNCSCIEKYISKGNLIENRENVKYLNLQEILSSGKGHLWPSNGLLQMKIVAPEINLFADSNFSQQFFVTKRLINL